MQTYFQTWYDIDMKVAVTQSKDVKRGIPVQQSALVLSVRKHSIPKEKGSKMPSLIEEAVIIESPK